jgi:hypothetical protein
MDEMVVSSPKRRNGLASPRVSFWFEINLNNLLVLLFMLCILCFSLALFGCLSAVLFSTPLL